MRNLLMLVCIIASPAVIWFIIVLSVKLGCLLGKNGRDYYKMFYGKDDEEDQLRNLHPTGGGKT